LGAFFIQILYLYLHSAGSGKNLLKMRNETTLRMELELPAYKITQWLETHNDQVEQEVETGVKMAIDQLTESGTLANMVKEQVIISVQRAITQSVDSWDFKNAMMKKIQDAVISEVDKYAVQIADAITSKINP
jgi:hypothetical protein